MIAKVSHGKSFSRNHLEFMCIHCFVQLPLTPAENKETKKLFKGKDIMHLKKSGVAITQLSLTLHYSGRIFY